MTDIQPGQIYDREDGDWCEVIGGGPVTGDRHPTIIHCAHGNEATYVGQISPEDISDDRWVLRESAVQIEDRWYVVDKNGTPSTIWSGEEAAIQAGKDWPSITASVLHLHGSANNPKIDVIWVPHP